MSRKSVPLSVKQQVLHESGYRCSNPSCRTILTLEIHHLDQVSDGGENTTDNLLTLCPNCHTLHHSGTISKESLKSWKQLQLSLNEGFNKASIDILLSMPQIKALSVTGDGFVHVAPLLTGGYLRLTVSATPIAGHAAGSFTLILTEKGKAFIEAWKSGDQRKAIEWTP